MIVAYVDFKSALHGDLVLSKKSFAPDSDWRTVRAFQFVTGWYNWLMLEVLFPNLGKKVSGYCHLCGTEHVNPVSSAEADRMLP
jgi:hypothetical protein